MRSRLMTEEAALEGVVGVAWRRGGTAERVDWDTDAVPRSEEMEGGERRARRGEGEEGWERAAWRGRDVMTAAGGV